MFLTSVKHFFASYLFLMAVNKVYIVNKSLLELLFKTEIQTQFALKVEKRT